MGTATAACFCTRLDTLYERHLTCSLASSIVGHRSANGVTPHNCSLKKQLAVLSKFTRPWVRLAVNHEICSDIHSWKNLQVSTDETLPCHLCSCEAEPHSYTKMIGYGASNHSPKTFETLDSLNVVARSFCWFSVYHWKRAQTLEFQSANIHYPIDSRSKVSGMLKFIYRT